MLKMFISPGRYVQGAGAILELGKHISVLGCKNALAVVDPIGIKAVGDGFYKSLKDAGIEYHVSSSKKSAARRR